MITLLRQLASTTRSRSDSRMRPLAIIRSITCSEVSSSATQPRWALSVHVLILSLVSVMLAEASHAADKIALICSDAKGKDDYSLSIDLDRKLASFHMSDLPDANGIPVTRVTENYVWFQNKALSGIYSQGKLDRITGSLHFFSSASQRSKRLLSNVQASEAV